MIKKNLLMLLFLLILAPTSHAASGVGIGTMFANFTSSAEAIMKLIANLSYVIGAFLVVNSMIKFSQVGQGQITPKMPITMFFVGVSVFALPSMLEVVANTMAMEAPNWASPLSGIDVSGTGSSTSDAAMKGVFAFIRMLGLIAFIRGFLMLNAAGQGKQDMIARALTHIFGGVAAMNVTLTAQIIANTIAPGLPIPGIN